MAESDYPAGAFDDSDAPFNEKSFGYCSTCDGSTKIPDDTLRLLMNCPDCDGTGEKSEQQAQDERESHEEDMRKR